MCLGQVSPNSTPGLLVLVIVRIELREDLDEIANAPGRI